MLSKYFKDFYVFFYEIVSSYLIKYLNMLFLIYLFYTLFTSYFSLFLIKINFDSQILKFK